MKPSEISMFTKSEQTLLVASEPDRLDALDEDELLELLGRFRRARNKYRDLHKRQSRSSIEGAGKRYAATTSNERTLRKAEIMEDALSRVARYASRAARAAANDLKADRIAAARAANTAPSAGQPATKKSKASTGGTKGKGAEPKITGARKGSVSARGKQSQARKDTKR